MKRVNDIKCPCCSGDMNIKSLYCSKCDVRVEGDFKESQSEFSKLTSEEWHLLRIFLQFEGRIKDMEAPLGLTYPTIRNKISNLRKKILGTNEVEIANGSEQSKHEYMSKTEILEALEKKEISFDEAMSLIKELKRRKSKWVKY